MVLDTDRVEIISIYKELLGTDDLSKIQINELLELL
jgi:hypothetical protein